MIELPGCSDGSEISPMPQRGPEASQRRSLAILLSDTAIVFSAPLVSTAASLAAMRLEVVRAPARTGARCAPPCGAMTASAKPGGAFRPVPTAVPPSASSASRGRAACRRSMPLLDLLRVAAELLAEADRDGVLQVRAADLHDVVELDGLGGERSAAAATSAGTRSSVIAA